MLGSGLPGGSFHNDVLSAQPTDENDKKNLVEGIKDLISKLCEMRCNYHI